MIDDRLIGMATFAVEDPARVVSVFEDLAGVLAAAAGVAAGSDAIQIEFDPGRISYDALLDVLSLEEPQPTIYWHSREQARRAARRFATARAPLFYRG